MKSLNPLGTKVFWVHTCSMRIMSIQSLVSYGHVGNSAAMFPLQRQGHEVMPVPTVVFSNHTGYGAWGGPMLTGDDVRDIVNGISDRGGLDDCALVLSGYQGGESIGGAILDAVALARQKNPQVLYSCDPVLGSVDKGCIVNPEVQNLIRDKVVPEADILTPNQFELGYITFTQPETIEETLAAVEKVRKMGPRVVLVTSVLRPDRPEDTIEMIAVDDSGSWIVQTPRLPFKVNGSGDVASALFASTYVETGSAPEALQKTAATIYELLENTWRAQARELLLVESQEAYVKPRHHFEVRRLA